MRIRLLKKARAYQLNGPRRNRDDRDDEYPLEAGATDPEKVNVAGETGKLLYLAKWGRWDSAHPSWLNGIQKRGKEERMVGIIANDKSIRRDILRDNKQLRRSAAYSRVLSDGVEGKTKMLANNFAL